MKNNTAIIILIVILSIIALAMIGGFIFLMNFGFRFNFNFNGKEMELVDSVTAKCDTIKKIDFDLSSTDVEIKKSENEEIIIELYSNTEENPQIEKDEDAIRLNEKNAKQSWGFFVNNRRKVVVYIPNDYIGEFDINTSSGDVLSQIDLSRNNAFISTTSGDIKLESICYSTINTTSGDVRVGTGSDSLSIKTTSGDVSIDKVQKDINVKTTSGDIRIEKLNINANSRIEATSGDVTINNNECNCYVEASSTSGDRHINHSDRKSDIVLDIKTTSGDINVN